MRIYPKKLRNIEDLEREKKLLQKESRLLEQDDFLSLEGLLGKKAGGKGKKEEAGFSLLDFLPVSNPMVDMLVQLVKKRMAKKDNDPRPERDADEKPAKSKLKSIAFEFIGGYLKWKAIELSYKGIRHIIKKNKEANS